MVRKLKNVEKWVTNTVLPGIWQETFKNMEYENHTEGPGVWQEK